MDDKRRREIFLEILNFESSMHPGMKVDYALEVIELIDQIEAESDYQTHGNGD